MKYHDGNSPAAWTAVVVMILGTLIGALAFPFDSVTLFVVGVVVILVGLVAGKVMSMAGFGNLPSYEVEEPADTVLEGPTSST